MWVRRKGAIADVKGPDGDPILQGSSEARRRAAARLIETHDAVFRRTARRYSICADDAEDAYQRALEILLTKAPPIDGDNLVRWMQTVTKREALDVRRGRERMLTGGHSPSDDRDPLDAIPTEAPGPDEKAASRERIARSNEALRSLKPNEVRALTLKAEGYSYAEIGDITGWTYTKINRCMAEGRKRFLAVFSELEHGDRCAEMTTALSAMVDGETGIDGSGDLHAHLRGCATCRAKLRAFRGVPHRVLELMPAGAATDLSTRGRASGWIADHFAAATDKVRELGYSAMARGSSSDSTVAAVGSGGTRGGGMAVVGKVLAVCGATAAGSAACVAGGVVTPPAIGGGDGPEPPAIVAPERPVAETPIDQGEVAPQPVSEPVAEQPAPDPAPAPTPAQQTKQQFDFEAAAAPAPAPAPSSSSSEFGGASGGGGSSGGGGGSSGAGNFGIE